VCHPRYAVRINFDGTDQIEPEKCQVGEIILGNLFSIQVGMNKSKTFEAG